MMRDEEIAAEVRRSGMIDPFVDHQVRLRPDGRGVRAVSYGLSSHGYDCRLGDEVLVFTPVHCHLPVDPKAFDDRLLTRVRADAEGRIAIPPHSYVLGKSVETFKIPDDVAADCVGKSTYARSAIHVNVTPLESAWHGELTIEVSNASPCPVFLYAGEGIAQIRFFRLSGRPGVTYADRAGKYQGQFGIVPPRA